MTSTSPRRSHEPGPKPGDRRRAALLEGLEQLLQTHSLNQIGVADISGAAAVTRSAFYFYFPTKAAAVAALLTDVFDEMIEAASEWYEGSSEPAAARLRSGMQASVARWREHAALMVAMLDAAGADADTRQLWQQWIDRFADRVAARIEADRAAGVAHQDVDTQLLATVLVDAVFQAMERDVRAIRSGHRPVAGLDDALTVIWHRAIYLDVASDHGQ
jgi:TetR/AcrR family transcriptional regulator, ethionamide resistance regulator